MMMKKTYCCFNFLLLLLTFFVGIHPLKAQKLWGLTSGGGANSRGTIFSINPDGTGAKVNYSFVSGVTGGGYQPLGMLVFNNNLLYGATNSGGANGYGVIFSFDTTTNTYSNIWNFTSATGSSPIGGLCTNSNGSLLYGVTNSGGTNGYGVIFSFDPSSNTYTDLYDMTSSGGYTCYGSLTLYHDKFYGVTQNGGSGNYGTFFSFDPATNEYTTIYNYSAPSFDASSYGYGGPPQAPGTMVVYNDVLYGVSEGGNDDYGLGYSLGQLFSYNDGGAGYKILYDFSIDIFFEPAGIVLYNGMLYGITYEDSYGGYGGIFTYDLNAGAYNEIATGNFSIPGWGNFGNITAYNGKLLAMGGTDIYRVDPVTGTYASLLNFSNISPSLGYSGNSYNSLLLPVDNYSVATGTTPQTISGMNDMQKIYGDTSFNPGAVASSGLKITYSTTDKKVASGSGSKIKIVGVGTCQVIATQMGDTTYARVDDTVTLTVSKASLLITADNKTINQLQPLPVFTAHYTGFVYGDTASSLTTLPNLYLDNGISSSSPQGTYPIYVNGATSPNYDISYATGTLTIIGQLQLFSLIDSAVRTYGAPDFPLVVSNSGLPVTYSIDSADIATVSTTDTIKVHITGAGLTRVIARQMGNNTWAAGYDTVWLQINKTPLTITANDTSIVYGQPVPVFTYTYNGFVYNDNESTAFSVKPVLIATNQETPPAPGTYQIQITDAVSQSYNLTYVNGVFTVNPSTDSMNVYCSGIKTLSVNIMSGKARKSTFLLYGLDGRQVLRSDLNLSKGLNYFSYPLNVTSGIYIARLSGEDIKLSQKVVVF